MSQGADSSPRGTVERPQVDAVADLSSETANVLSSPPRIGRTPRDPLGPFVFCCVFGSNQLKNN